MNGAVDQYPHLSKAPIVEAVIDFRVNLPSDFKLELLHPMRARLTDTYPDVEEQQLIEQMIKREPGQAAEFSTRVSGIHGYRLCSKPGIDVIQLRRDGFTFSRLHPYTKWDDVFNEAWRLWTMYAEAAKPLEISRIAVRYINRLPLPLPLSDPGEYLNAPPMIAEGWRGNLRTFLSRIVLHEPESNVSVNITQALESQASGGETKVALLFDIDAYQDVSLSADDVTIRERFAKLRETKNRVFFKGLTHKAIGLFR